MRYQTIDVTPEMAKEWLEKNADFQRKLRENVVEKYARDMRSGEWKLTHQGIAFDTKGRLIDGQHRLAAIAKSGVTVRMTVVRDAPDTAFDHVDIGFGRTASDILKARGEAWITNDWIATARFMEHGSNIKSATIARSPFELREMVYEHKAALDFVFQNLERKVSGVTTAPVLAAVGLAYYHEKNRAMLADFLRLLVNGVAQNPKNDSTTIRLRDWLKESSGLQSSASRWEMFLKTQRVIKAYMTGETLTKLYMPSEPCYKVKKRSMLDAAEDD